ncbi:hypothetical protein [Campylobacter sp. CCS1377]|uniref:Phage-Barnase-EndoU-ColicinE5/D-RelE like nuclease 3 domain-containing protein n=1 Tax=Campylobacter sp. CCS1377 TaxID=3158229 RepID=A0AAU7E951_9BACT|nr:hypothetical protein [Campylobacter jejuni]
MRRTISRDNIYHTISRHGAQSALVRKSKQQVVMINDISKWIDYADNADIQAFSKDSEGRDVLISGKQLNGNYYVIVEQIRSKNNELAFKTMYFENGNLENSNAFNEARIIK